MDYKTRQAQMAKLEALVASYSGAKKAKARAEEVMSESKEAIQKLVLLLGVRHSESTKRVEIGDYVVDVRVSERAYPVDGCVAYVEEHLPELADSLLGKHLDIAAVDSAILDDLLMEEDVQNLIMYKSTDSLIVKEAKA